MKTDSQLDLALVRSEWEQPVNRIYLNSGSCGMKPKSVLEALQNGWARLNQNPTLMTFIDDDPWQKARAAAATLFSVTEDEIMLTQNSTFGIQMIMQSLLLNEGDEFVTTTQEHSCVRTLSQYLAESRGIVIRQYEADPFAGSKEFCRGLLGLLTDKTRLVLVSQINCLTGWRPDLKPLLSALSPARVPLLVDGAHVPGQGPVEINDFPFWVASAHKWMGAPNGCGFLYAKPEYRSLLRPLTVGDRYYAQDYPPMHRLEWPGTCDPVRLLGLEAALNLQLKLGPEKIAVRQKELQAHLRDRLESLRPSGTIRSPWIDGETSALLNIYWSKEQLLVDDLRASLWQDHAIWTQPDYASITPQYGMRVSSNVFNTEQEIDRLVDALSKYLSN